MVYFLKVNYRDEVLFMIYKNVEFHNVGEILHNDDGSISWKRIPSSVHENTELQDVVYNSTGVELRFVMKSDTVTIRMCKYDKESKNIHNFHVFRGAIQGSWKDHEVHHSVSGEIEDYVIEKPKHPDHLKAVDKMLGYEWDSDVVRVIFDRGRYRIYDIIGDVEPPKPSQTPKKTLLSYGSSITHGSNSIDRSHSWVSILAHNLNMDAINLGMAGSCRMEPAMADYIATMGAEGKWHICTLELGINVLSWDDDLINERVNYIIRQVAGKNPEKPIFVISPFYHYGDDFSEEQHAKRWRRHIEKIVKELNYPNVTYINGFDILDSPAYISADEVHPNIYGCQRIADKMTEILNNALKK